MMAPLPRNYEEWQRRQNIDSILHQVYTNPNVGFEIQMGDEWIVNPKATTAALNGQGKVYDRIDDKDPSTYGEITATGTRQLLHAMGLLLKQKHTDENNAVHFYDLGSGAGKLIAQVAMELPDTEATGIELSPSRYEAAVKAKKMLESFLLQPEQELQLAAALDRVQFLPENILNVDLSRATHIYVASLCFPRTLLSSLEDKLIQECNELRFVATLQRFPNELRGSKLELSSVQYMEMSWTKPLGCPVFLYHHKRS
jgi:SAM-dependent methyltransferase